MAFVQAQSSWGSISLSYQKTSDETYYYANIWGNKKYFVGTGSPDGVITGSAGDKALDISTGIEYTCPAAGTEWRAIQTAQGLADTPLSCGIEMSIGGKSYISAYGSCTVGLVYVLNGTGTEDQELTALANTGIDSVYQRIAVAAATIATAIGWFQVSGIVNASVEGTTDVAAGNTLKVLKTETAFKKDGAADPANRSENTSAVALEAVTDAGPDLASVFLLNRDCIIAA